ncbi:MAG: hypothetical protein M0P26_04820 [Bacteroidales bacterium]|nr:hypothetical protein [Bacteroidales bacterium]
MKKKYYTLGVCLFFLGVVSGYLYFRSEREKEIKLLMTAKSMNDFGPSIEELKKNVLTKGDTLAYEELSIRYFNVNYSKGEFLFYSIIMANKYCYPPAFFNVYRCLTEIFEHNNKVGSIDEKTKELALKYLKEGANLNEYNALNTLSTLYLNGVYVPKDTMLGNILAKRAANLDIGL